MLKNLPLTITTFEGLDRLQEGYYAVENHSEMSGGPIHRIVRLMVVEKPYETNRQQWLTEGVWVAHDDGRYESVRGYFSMRGAIWEGLRFHKIDFGTLFPTILLPCHAAP